MRSRLAILSCLALLGAIAACDRAAMEANNTMASGGDLSGPPGEGVYCPAVEQRVSKTDCEDLTRADSEVRPGAAAFNVPDPMRRGETFEVHLVIDRRSPREIRVIEAPLEDMTDLNLSATDLNASDLNASGSDLNALDDDPAVNASEADDPAPREKKAGAGREEQAPTPGQIVDPLKGSAERFYPKVGRHMRAELIGKGFDITAKSEASQQIPLGGNATWIWNVKALEGGSQSLTLVTVVEGLADGRRFVLARTPTVRTVTVEVSLRDRIWDTLTEAPAWIKAITAVVAAFGALLTAWYALPWWRRRRKDKGSAPADRTDEGDSGGDE